MNRFIALYVCAFLGAGLPCLATGTHPEKNTAAAGSDALTVPASDIAAENAYWQRLGAPLPKDGVMLAHPWSPPWSGRSLVVPAAWLADGYRQIMAHLADQTDMRVDAAALRADLPILHFVMEKNYSGWESAAKHGWNWDDWFRRWDAMLAGHGTQSIPAGTAFAPWYAYENFQIDSHSGPGIPEQFQLLIVSRSAVLQRAPTATCSALVTTDGKRHPLDPDDPAQQPHTAWRWNGRALQPASYIAYPSSRGEVDGIVCGGTRIAATPTWTGYLGTDHPGKTLEASFAALAGNRKGLAVYDTPAPGIGYLRLAAFNEAGDEALRKLSASLPATAGHERLLIVDLRGNSGGAAPIAALSRWIPVARIHPQLDQVRKSSCLYPGLWFNLFQFLSRDVHTPTTTAYRGSEAHAMRTIDAPSSSTHCPVSFDATRGGWHYAAHRFVRHWRGRRPRLLVLVDNGCASDCEYTTFALAQLPGTVIAGSNTNGLIGFTQPGFVVLPHTRLGFELSTSLTDAYGDGRSANGYGLDVDIVLPTADDWSRASILALARLLATDSPYRARASVPANAMQGMNARPDSTTPGAIP